MSMQERNSRILPTRAGYRPRTTGTKIDRPNEGDGIAGNVPFSEPSSIDLSRGTQRSAVARQQTRADDGLARPNEHRPSPSTGGTRPVHFSSSRLKRIPWSRRPSLPSTHRIDPRRIQSRASTDSIWAQRFAATRHFAMMYGVWHGPSSAPLPRILALRRWPASLG